MLRFKIDFLCTEIIHYSDICILCISGRSGKPEDIFFSKKRKICSPKDYFELCNSNFSCSIIPKQYGKTVF